MSKKVSGLTRAVEFLELPGETVAGVPKLTITGCRRMLVENHRGLKKYGRELIEIDGGRVIVRVRGEGLELISMRRDDMLITGNIYSTEFDTFL